MLRGMARGQARRARPRHEAAAASRRPITPDRVARPNEVGFIWERIDVTCDLLMEGMATRRRPWSPVPRSGPSPPGTCCRGTPCSAGPTASRLSHEGERERRGGGAAGRTGLRVGRVRVREQLLLKAVAVAADHVQTGKLTLVLTIDGRWRRTPGGDRS